MASASLEHYDFNVLNNNMSGEILFLWHVNKGVFVIVAILLANNRGITFIKIRTFL